MTAPVGLREQIAAAIHKARCLTPHACADDDATAYDRDAADAVLSVVAGQVDALAAVLAEHLAKPLGPGMAGCSGCDWWFSTDGPVVEAFTKHQAAVAVARMVGGQR